MSRKTVNTNQRTEMIRVNKRRTFPNVLLHGADVPATAALRYILYIHSLVNSFINQPELHWAKPPSVPNVSSTLLHIKGDLRMTQYSSTAAQITASTE